MKKLRRENKDLKGLFVGGNRTLEYFPLNIEGVKDFTFTNVGDLRKIDGLFYIDKFLLKGLLFTDGDVWKHQRKVLSSRFIHAEFKNKVEMINQVTDFFYEMLKKDKNL